MKFTHEMRVGVVRSMHPGFKVMMRISGFTVDCTGCTWRGFTHHKNRASVLHQGHVAQQIEDAGL